MISGVAWNASATRFHKLVSTDGVIKNLRVKLTGLPGAGKHYDFTLMLNGAPTALTCEVNNASVLGSDMAHSIDVTGGDYIYLQCNPDGAPTSRVAAWTIMFEGDNDYESLILGGSNVTLDTAATEYGEVMGFCVWDAVENNHRQVIPTAGTIKNFYVQLSIDPGTDPDAYRFTLRKGTPPGAVGDTALVVTIVADNTTGSNLVNTVDVVAGDVVTLKVEPLNGPSAIPMPCWGLTFVADINGESITIGGSQDDLDSAATEYQMLAGYALRTWEAVEGNQYQLGQECTIKKLHILLTDAPGVGESYTFTVRAAGDTNVVAVVDGLNTTGNSGVLEDTVANDDYMTLKVVPSP